MKPGINRGVPMAAYLAHEALSQSTLSEFRRSPLHARYRMLQPREDTAALILGEATHYAILEPDKFNERYKVPPDVDRRTKDGKATWQAFIDDNPRSVALSRDEYDRAQAMVSAIETHAEARRFLYGQGQNEITVLWTDERTKIDCKARPDRITFVDGWTWCVDVKTCRDAGQDGFSRAVYQFGYFRKAAWYLDALDAIKPMPRRFLFVAVESEAPHGIALYELSDGAIKQGQDENRAALDRYAECVSTGIWPGYPNMVTQLDLPRWAQAVEV
jgi:exodeoxyribonuclease VIII